MTVKRYEVVGRTNTPLDALADAAVGDFITASFDEATEATLIDAGALRPAPTKPPASSSKSPDKSTGKDGGDE